MVTNMTFYLSVSLKVELDLMPTGSDGLHPLHSAPSSEGSTLHQLPHQHRSSGQLTPPLSATAMQPQHLKLEGGIPIHQQAAHRHPTLLHHPHHHHHPGGTAGSTTGLPHHQHHLHHSQDPPLLSDYHNGVGVGGSATRNHSIRDDCESLLS